MATAAEIIDNYARQKNYYPWIPYVPVGQTIVAEVERMGRDGLYVSTAAALVEKESGFKNLFGCDWGSRWTYSPPFCQVRVTKNRVRRLIRNIESGGGQNGVGLTQLTTIGLVREAEAMGGAHLPRYQMRVGFKYLNDLIAALGWPAGAAAYNAGAGNWRSVAGTYGADMARLEREWAARLARADAIGLKDSSLEPGPPGGNGGNVPKWEEATRYAEMLADRKPDILYWFWDGGSLERSVNGRPGCKDGPPPPPQQIRRGFCADLVTLAMRKVGRPVPKNHIWPGGTRSFWLNYRGVMVPFRLSECRRGDVAFWDYMTYGPKDEGHIGICGGAGAQAKFIQSFADTAMGTPGFNRIYTLQQSHAGGAYRYRIPREKLFGV